MRRGARGLWDALASLPRRGLCALANLRRRLRRRRIPQYVRLDIGDRVAERAAPASFPWRWLSRRPAPQSLEALRADLLAIARDPLPEGIVLRIDKTDLTLAQAQSAAALLDEFRRASPAARRKRVVCYLHQCNAPCYVIGAAADRLAISPLTPWDLNGALWQNHYLQRFLARLGLEFDVVRAGRWKTAATPLTSAYMTRDERTHLASVVASLFDQVAQAIARGRGLSLETVRAALDEGPLLPDEALQRGLVDDVCPWSRLPQRLAGDDLRAPPKTVRPLGQVKGLLRRVYRRRHPLAIGVIEVKGVIAMGSAQSTPWRARDEACGHRNLLAAIQTAAHRQRRLAGVILYVDSPGGSALASHIVHDALRVLAQQLPLVVYMGGVAASGGYYLAMAGVHVIAQSATLTGSIGVVAGKPVASALLGALGIHSAQIAHGANAALHSLAARWTAPQRALMQRHIDHCYREFKQVVQEGRNMDAARLDELAEGRLWTGLQARTRNLVDETGPWTAAVERVRQEAGIPADRAVRVESLGPNAKTAHLHSALASTRWMRWLDRTAQRAEARPMEWTMAADLWMLAEDLAPIPDGDAAGV